MTSVKREAAIRIFERGDAVSLSAIAREITETVGPVTRQAVTKWLKAWREETGNQNKGLEMSATKGGPVQRQPANPVPQSATQPATESLQSRPRMTLAERRANARALILDALARGAYRKFAAARGGIALATLYNWMNSDPEFKAAVEAVEADAVHDVVGALYDDAVHGKVGQRAVPSAIWLERRHPGLYGRRANVAVDVEVRGQLDVKRIISDPSLVEQMSSIERAIQNAELGGPVIDGEVTALPPHEEVDE